MIYLDHNATTPLAREAFAEMEPYLTRHFGNPSSIHAAGRQARAAVDDARDRLAAILRAKSHEIVFTSGGTEADNLGILGLARSCCEKGTHLITAATEHHAVLHAFKHLEKAEGFQVTVLPVDGSGLIDPDALRKAMTAETTLVSIMSANNETGVVQDIENLVAICREKGVLFHSDVVQSFGKEKLQPEGMGVDAISLAAHKFYGPKGVGALWLRAGLPIQRLHHGGAHENERRAGTENVAAIVGMAAAAELVVAGMEAEQARQASLRDRLWEGIHALIPETILNGANAPRLGNTLNVSFPGFDGEGLLINLDLEGICASSGSACLVGSIQSSHVLQAMGVAPDLAQATVRFSLGKGTTAEEIDQTIQALGRIAARTRPIPA